LKLAAPGFRQLRLEARMKAVGTREGNEMEVRIRRYLSHEFKKYECHVTGDIVLLGKMSRELVYYQARGFEIAFLCILMLVALVFRSLKLGLLVAVPKLLPILMIYGIMGFARIELSSPTAMIANIVLGLIVASSIHFLHRFRLEYRNRQHYLQALHHTFRHVGQSLVISTFILCAGFASSAFASFRPTILLGLLTSLTVLFSLICTLVVLPVSIIMVKPFGPHRLFKRPGKSPR
jgi:predicted RND superfamily exporter protein